ncbi:hypothetical protein B0H10DRAFT_2194969 [Mycena sp. CBHHK59/15]|nr:hypothetical protein B0H10DRAFT_2194969 [Mycena sp. CBHHK59/15]
MHGDVNGAEDVHGGVPHVCGTVHNVKEVGSDVRDAEDRYRGVYDLEGACGEVRDEGACTATLTVLRTCAAACPMCAARNIVKEVGGDVRDAEDVYWGVYDLEGACGEVRDKGTCAATWTARRTSMAPCTMSRARGRCARRGNMRGDMDGPRMCAAPRTMWGRWRATWGTWEMSAATWTVDGEPTTFGRHAARVQRED